MQIMTRRKVSIYCFKKKTLVISYPHPIDLLRFHCPTSDILKTATKNPINAKGIAKMVCENLISDK